MQKIYLKTLAIRMGRRTVESDLEWQWLNLGFENLKKTIDKSEWITTSLTIDGFGPDPTDTNIFLLAAKAIENKDQVLVRLPDKSYTRSPLIFSSILTLKWFDYQREGKRQKHVLYFSDKLGIREQLHKVRLGKTKVRYDSILPKIHLEEDSSVSNGGEIDSDNSWEVYLPKVTCVYSPADPTMSINKYAPDWIVVNCNNEPKIDWINRLFDFAKSKTIPVIAWYCNPFFENSRYLKSKGFSVFSWPYSLEGHSAIKSPNGVISKIEPVLICEEGQYYLTNANRLIVKSSKLGEGRLLKDASLVGLRLLSALISIPVPLNIYQAENSRYWGISDIEELRTAFSHFVERIEEGSKSKNLGESLELLNKYYDYVKISDPPLWNSLLQIIRGKIFTDNPLVILFPSRAKKNLFSFSLLSHENISDAELRKRGIYINDLREFNSSTKNSLLSETFESKMGIEIMYESLPKKIVFVGFPTNNLIPKLESLLTSKRVSFLIQEFQESALKQQVQKINDMLCENLNSNIQLIERYTLDSFPHNELKNNDTKFPLQQAVKIEVKGNLIRPEETDIKISVSLDSLTEIEAILSNEDYGDREQPIFVEENPEKVTAEDTEKIWSEEGIEVKFGGGWRCIFGTDDMVQVLYHTYNGTEGRTSYVSSLRTGDEVIFINGQNKRNLYDLIINRIHENPAIDIHLRLIMKWREEFVKQFVVKSHTKEYQNMNPFDHLLSKMQDDGSRLISSFTLYLWYKGSVLAPEDPEDLLRVAKELDMKFVLEYHSQIFKAAQRLRNLHRKLSRSLNRWLEERSLDIAERRIEIYESIDDQLGLTFEDFEDSISVMKVQSSSPIRGPFYKEELGKLEQGG